jgi:hypothetical protein
LKSIEILGSLKHVINIILHIRYMVHYTKWPEIQYMIDASRVKQKPAERADITVRVFMIKLRELLRDIVKGKRFGKTLEGWYKEFIIFFIILYSY